MGLGIPIPSKVSQCPQHYGICVSQVYESWKHDDQAVAVDPFHGKQMATDPLIWVIHRGDLIRPDKATTSNFVVECMFTSGAHRAGDSILITIVSTRLEDPPSKMADLPSGEITFLFYIPLNILAKQVPNTQTQTWLSTWTYQ